MQLSSVSQKFLNFICCRPLPLSVGFITQYVLKPALGVLVAQAFGMSQMFYAGFVLTSCVSGAQLSSYASFLSKGDVALSILLTSITTISSVLLTPLLSGVLIGAVVPVDAIAMSKSILQVYSLLHGWLVFLSESQDDTFPSLFSGCCCSNRSRPHAQYVCKTSCSLSSTCDATCCNDMHFLVHR